MSNDKDIVVQQKNKMVDDTPVQTSLLSSFKAPQRTTPTYLVILNNGKPKEADSYFIAIKRDDAISTCAKFVGFFSNKPEREIKSSYDQIIKETDITDIIEIEFPWNKICSVQSLVYRHKPVK
jgi:hypothetical protein